MDVSLNQFELTGLPCLVEPRLQWAVKAQKDVPTFVWNGLNPVGFAAFGRGWAKPNIYRAVGVDDNALCLAADAGELFIGLQHRAGLIVIDNERPEILRWDVRRQVNLVGLAAVQRLAFGVHERGSVLRA